MDKPLVLIVEDNPINLRLMTAVLGLEKCPFGTATSVEEGRAFLKSSRPTLVFMDIQVPGGGGEVLLKEIRANSELAHTRVLAVTALNMDGDRERILAAGFDDYFSKPIDTKKIREVVRQHVGALAPKS
jgi:CheY-like chemotaxis protein